MDSLQRFASAGAAVLPILSALAGALVFLLYQQRKSRLEITKLKLEIERLRGISLIYMPSHDEVMELLGEKDRPEKVRKHFQLDVPIAHRPHEVWDIQTLTRLITDYLQRRDEFLSEGMALRREWHERRQEAPSDLRSKFDQVLRTTTGDNA
jgi:hypothetical protein